MDTGIGALIRRFKRWTKEAARNPWLPIRIALAIGPFAMYIPHADEWMVPYLLAGISLLLIALFSIVACACFCQE